MTKHLLNTISAAFLVIATSILAASCQNTRAVVGGPLDPLPRDGGGINTNDAVTVVADIPVDALSEVGLDELARKWAVDRSPEVFTELSERIGDMDAPDSEEVKYLVVKYLGRPDEAGLLAEPASLGYALSGGGRGVVTFPPGRAPRWELTGAGNQP